MRLVPTHALCLPVCPVCLPHGAGAAHTWVGGSTRHCHCTGGSPTRLLNRGPTARRSCPACPPCRHTPGLAIFRRRGGCTLWLRPPKRHIFAHANHRFRSWELALLSATTCPAAGSSPPKPCATTVAVTISVRVWCYRKSVSAFVAIARTPVHGPWLGYSVVMLMASKLLNWMIVQLLPGFSLEGSIWRHKLNAPSDNDARVAALCNCT